MFRKLVLSLAAAAGLISQVVALPAEAAMDVGAFAPPAALAATSPIDLARPGLVLVRLRMAARDRLGRRRRLA
jgi:hypothetical protein